MTVSGAGGLYPKELGAIWGKAIPKRGGQQICLSLKRTRKLLSVGVETIHRLDALGLLPGTPRTDGAGRSKKMVDFRAYMKFRQTYVFTDEARGILKITRKKLYEWIQAGKIKIVTNIGYGRRPRFLLDRVEITNLSP